jgi:hypothetical protein
LRASVLEYKSRNNGPPDSIVQDKGGAVVNAELTIEALHRMVCAIMQYSFDLLNIVYVKAKVKIVLTLFARFDKE